VSAVPQAEIRAADRLSFTVFVAIALHALMVLTDFIQEEEKTVAHTMEITLSRFDDNTRPDEADFLANTNQKGGGTLEEKTEQTSPTKAIEESMLIQESGSPVKQQEQQTGKKAAIVTHIADRSFNDLFEANQELANPTKHTDLLSLIEREVKIAELEASYDRQLQQYAKKPRVTRLAAASTMKAVDAQYIDQVSSKIERLGKQFFPRDGGKKLYGEPRLLISIYSDGSLRDVQILKSSGLKTLDSKTLDIVQRSAPFAPFPKEVRKERDVLELIRTFKFVGNGVYGG